jgi:uncharacterized membrane protein
MEKHNIKNIFKRGFIALAPIIVSAVIAIWIIQSLERFFAPIFIKIIGEKYYFTGIGFVFSLIIIFLIGLLINTWLIKKVYRLGEILIRKIPFLGIVYSTIKDVLSYFETKKNIGEPVKVNLLDVSCIGFITRKDFEEIFSSATINKVSVFIPLSYQIGGITLIVDISKIEKIDLNVEEALRFAFSGGVLAKK